MAHFLRRRLTCFYCGKKSKQLYTAGLQRWDCESCEAPNYLDSDGESTEPPPARTPPANPRFGRPVLRATSPGPPLDDSSLFCQTCLKNQALLTQNLANYLPLPDHPKYQEYEAKYPEFRLALEQRFPQVCGQCEGRVQQRIRESGYAAKADHLRRVMERAKDSQAAATSWIWRWRAAVVGGTLWTLALIGHILWNGLGALQVDDNELRDISPAPGLGTCLSMAYGSRYIEPRCAESVRPLVGWAILLSLLSIWWNPVMGRRTLARVGGLAEFYKLQCILLFARFSTWYLLREDSGYVFERSVEKAIHAVMLAFNIAVPLICLRTIRADSGPQISFREAQQPLVSSSPQYQERHITTSTPTQPTSFKKSFPVSALASPSHRREKAPSYRPPTPPFEDDPDAMDLDTPRKPVQLNPTSARLNRPQTESPEPSPFLGQLPSAPQRRWQNVSQTPQKVNPKKANLIVPAAGTGFGFRSQPLIERAAAPQGDQPSTPKMAQPKYFAPESMATGLESLLTGFLSFEDAPPELRSPPKTSSVPYPTPSSTPLHYDDAPSAIHQYRHFIYTLFLLLASALWHLASNFPSLLAYPMRMTALGTAGSIPALRILSAFGTAFPWSATDILLLLVELLTAFGLIRQVHYADRPLEDAIGVIPQAFLFFIIAQELVLWARERRPSATTATGTAAAFVQPSNFVPEQHHAEPELESQPPRRVRSPIDQTIANLPPLPSKPAPAMRSDFSSLGSGSTIGERVASRRERSQSPASPIGGMGFAGLNFGQDEGRSSGVRGGRTVGRRQMAWQVGGL